MTDYLFPEHCFDLPPRFVALGWTFCRENALKALVRWDISRSEW